MQHDFWHKKWQDNKIGFHTPEANPLLTQNIEALKLAQGARIFIPLCGKTLDIAWLLAQGFSVAGAELSEMAIEQLFEQLEITPKITQLKKLKLYNPPNIDIYVGDIFEISANQLGKIDAIYDRAALVALPPELRIKYTKHLMDTTNAAPQLLICYEYNQNERSGPPFSVSTQEIQQHYADNYDIKLLENKLSTFNQGTSEKVWHLAQP